MTRSASGSDPSPSHAQPVRPPRCFSPVASHDAMHHVTWPRCMRLRAPACTHPQMCSPRGSMHVSCLCPLLAIQYISLPCTQKQISLVINITAVHPPLCCDSGLGASCHGLSPDPPYPSKASLPPPMVGPISNAFRSTSDPTGSSAYFSLSLTDSRMFLLAFFT